MSFDWKELLFVAESLWPDDEADESKRPNSEALRRSAINRAYYSSHCRARIVLESKGVSFSSDGKAHFEVADKIKRYGGRDGRRAGDDLFGLLDNRIKADYRNSVNNISNLTQASLIFARDIHSFLDQQASI